MTPEQIARLITEDPNEFGFDNPEELEDDLSEYDDEEDPDEFDEEENADLGRCSQCGGTLRIARTVEWNSKYLRCDECGATERYVPHIRHSGEPDQRANWKYRKGILGTSKDILRPERKSWHDYQ